MTLKKLKPGMTVYRVKRSIGSEKWSTWPMYIKEVDIENERVLASGYAGEQWRYKPEWSKWRLKEPN